VSSPEAYGALTVPRRLPAPAPGWTVAADVVVVGSGIAGLTVAVQVAREVPDAAVLLVTKTDLQAGSTRWAQGGIAAALDPSDGPDRHLADTLAAGGGLCDAAAVGSMVADGPAKVRALAALGARFDRGPGGGWALTREGGHLARRIAHAGGDATGAEIARALAAVVAAAASITVVEQALALDLLTDAAGRAAGVVLHVLGEGRQDGVGAALAPAVVLATGGLGQAYARTTNPEVSTGDGVAVALRAGAEISDLEFIQFHPTVLWTGPAATGQQPLVSEAVRGEGAVLVDGRGRPVMAGQHPLGDLAPRDVVTRAIIGRLRETGAEHVFLDARHVAGFADRFPTVTASCRAIGVDPARDLVPVAPAAHYASGGVRTDLAGRSSVPGLYACGEVACTGVHGANRLASNSLLEGVVFAAAVARTVCADLTAVPAGRRRTAERVGAPVDHPVGSRASGPLLVDGARRADVQQAMTDGAGVLRSAESLADAAVRLAKLAATGAGAMGPPAWEATNLLTVGWAVAAAASAREETRGCHWREDYPQPRREWRRHLVWRVDAGRLVVASVPENSHPWP